MQQNSKIMEVYQYLRKNVWCGIWSQRILSEVGYLLEVSYYNNNAYRDLLSQVMDQLLAQVKENGAIDRETALRMEAQLAPMAELAKSYEVLLVGHAHIDMNWKWGFQETVNITIDTFETVLQLMEEYPQFVFSQSQAAVYKILEEYKPELLQRVKEKVHEGRWEVTASTWVENDKNMSGSESQARHILQTKSYLSEILDIPMESLDLDFEPDTFGHPETMPELFAQGGIRYYYHCRGNDKNNIYRWQAPSGAEVLVYREPIWYNDQRCEYDCLGFVPGFCHMYGLRTAMKVYGVGDHGGGPTRQELNHFRQMQTWPLMPVLKFSAMRPFFRCLEQIRQTLPVVRRELNFIFSGCYTTEGRIKRGNKICEDRMYEAELLDAAAKMKLDSYTTPSEFGKAWENILFNQFHDILPGSCILDTVEAAMGQYQKTLATAQVNMKDAMIKLCRNMDTTGFGPEAEFCPDSEDERCLGAGAGYGTDNKSGFIVSQVDRSNGRRRVFTVFNPTPYHRVEPATVTIWDWEGDPNALYATDTQGREFACQLLKEADYWAHHYTSVLMDVDVPAMGYATYVLDVRTPECFDTDWASFRACGNVAKPPVVDYLTDAPLVMENDLVKVLFSPNTLQMLSFRDKNTGKELIAQPSCGFRLITENTTQRMTAWRVGHYMKVTELNTAQPVKLIAHTKGALRQSIQYEIPFGDSRLKVTAFLDAHSSVVEFDLRVIWREVGTEDSGIPQLNFNVPFTCKANRYMCGIPMGVLEREPLAQDVPCVGFMAGLSEAEEKSVFVMSDCKYGFRGWDDSVSLTLLRSSFLPDPWPDQGEHTIRLGVGIGQKADVVRIYEKFVHPLAVCTNQIHKGTLPAVDSWLQLTGNARIQAVKAAEDGNGMILRVHNLEKTEQDVTLTMPEKIARAEMTDIFEKCGTAVPVDGDCCTFRLAPGALRTLRICY